MKRLVGFVAVALLVSGCATNSSVKSMIDPLAERITALENKQAATDAKFADLGKKSDAQTAEIQGLRKDLADSTAASQAAQKAAADAQAAATRAESAADKATKAFELKQVKGKK
jgi:peptidoglycan hydrolase CwlO-like protein